MDIKQVFHPFSVWEDHKHGFYNNISGGNKTEMTKHVIQLFCDPEKTKELMERVVKEWPFSCEHNFTNESMNKIAYLGQAACSLYKGVPCTVTMEAWSKVPKEFQDIADGIAEVIINQWETDYTCQK